MMITFNPTMDYDQAVQMARRDMETWFRACREGAVSVPQGEGSLLMKRDRQATIEGLRDPLGAKRLEAISLVLGYWPPNEVFAEEVLRLAFHDSEACIRGAALTALARLAPFIEDSSDFLPKLLADLFPPSADAIAGTKAQLAAQGAIVDAKLERIWRKLAGGHADDMLKSAAATTEFIGNADPELRRAALFALSERWKMTSGLDAICERLLLTDSDTEVRSTAVTLLACCYAHSDDKRVGRTIAGILYDEANSAELRVDAYRSLHTLRGMPTASLIRAHAKGFRFPEDVDWDFAATFL